MKLDTGIYPPLGLLYIASSLKKYGFFDVRVIDGQVLKEEEKYLLSIVKAYRPECVGISGHTLTLSKAVRMARAIKEIVPSTHITLGGPHIKIYPLETLSLPCVDSVIPDDGEISYPEMIKTLEAGTLPYGVKGVYFKDSGRIVTNEKREPLRDLDSLPFPDRSQLDSHHYFLVSNRARLSTTLISSRGCPYTCTFCPAVDKAYRQRSPTNVVDEIEECMGMGIRIFNFMDDAFNLTKKRVVGISKEILRRHLTIEWTFIGRVDIVDREMLEIAKDSGLTRVSFGIESGSDEILKSLRKGFTIAEAREAVRLCRELGIYVYGSFVLGAPYETREQAKKTIGLAFDLGIDIAQFYPLIPGPGTRLYTMALERGGIKKDYFKEYALNPERPIQFKYWETTFTQKEIQKIVRSAYRNFYLRPGFLFKSLTRVSSPTQIWRQVKAGLSMATYALGISQ